MLTAATTMSLEVVDQWSLPRSRRHKRFSFLCNQIGNACTPFCFPTVSRLVGALDGPPVSQVLELQLDLGTWWDDSCKQRRHTAFELVSNHGRVLRSGARKAGHQSRVILEYQRTMRCATMTPHTSVKRRWRLPRTQAIGQLHNAACEASHPDTWISLARPAAQLHTTRLQFVCGSMRSFLFARATDLLPASPARHQSSRGDHHVIHRALSMARHTFEVQSRGNSRTTVSKLSHGDRGSYSVHREEADAASCACTESIELLERCRHWPQETLARKPTNARALLLGGSPCCRWEGATRATRAVVQAVGPRGSQRSAQ